MVELRDEDDGRIALIMERDELPFALEALMRAGYALTPPSEADAGQAEDEPDELDELDEDEPDGELEEPEAEAEEPDGSEEDLEDESLDELEDEPEEDLEDEPEEESRPARGRPRKARSG